MWKIMERKIKWGIDKRGKKQENEEIETTSENIKKNIKKDEEKKKGRKRDE